MLGLGGHGERLRVAAAGAGLRTGILAGFGGSLTIPILLSAVAGGALPSGPGSFWDGHGRWRYTLS